MTQARLTVAVCTYRRFDWLKKCLNALERQTLSATGSLLHLKDRQHG